MKKFSEAHPVYLHLGDRIAKLRKALGKSQAELAAGCGLSRGSVANIELARQQVPLHTLWRIADLLEVEPRSLLPTDEEIKRGSPYEGRVAEADEHHGGSRSTPTAADTFIAGARKELRADDSGEDKPARRSRQEKPKDRENRRRGKD